MSYEEVLNEIYANKEKPVFLFKKYNLESVIKNTINLVRSKTAIDNPKPVHIGGMSAIMLHEVNSRLKNVSNEQEKRELELLVSDIAFYLLNQVLQKTTGNHAEMLIEVKESLKDACITYKYDYEQLMLLFNLDRFAKIVSTVEQRSSSTETTSISIHYEWLGKDYELDELARDLKSAGIIKLVREFKSLFEEKPQMVQFDAAKIEHVIVLFNLLKEHKLIFVKGNRGHLHPLKIYGVDFDKKVLIKKSPKSINYSIKKNPAKWNKIARICNQWIDRFKQQKVDFGLTLTKANSISAEQ